MKSLIEYLGCGYTTLENRGTIDFKVTKISNIRDVIIPFFNKYPLQGVKSKDFSDFCKAVDIVGNKAHLSKEGLDQIRIIKNRMNTNRKE
jgi:LAGLIDADG DNA endonuclease family protein